jgi:hypothetical protein
MIEFLVSLFVQKPLTILAVAVLFVGGYLLMEFTALGSGRTPRALLVAAGAWGAYAIWEWLVRTRTPEANIRVDLLVIWPLLAILSVWMVVRAIRPH